MADDASIRVLLWMAPGIQRSIVAAALREAKGFEILNEDEALPEWPEPDNASALREAMRRWLPQAVRRWLPDAVILSASSAEVRRLVGNLDGTAVVLVSTDGRSALGYEGDISGGALARLVRAVANHAQQD